MPNNIDGWIIGAGPIAREYAKIVTQLEYNTIIIGRGEDSAKRTREELKLEVISGGIDKFLSTEPEIPDFAIIAVNIDKLSRVTLSLLKYGVQNILVEKPAGLDLSQIRDINDYMDEINLTPNVFVAYNRRFYEVVQKLKQRIKEDGGITSFNFEFTEWSHEIEKLDKSQEVKENWLLANSSHVLDLAFFLGGLPINFNSYAKGKLSWHSKASRFSGAGICGNDVLFSYNANWDAPGRWGVEFLTSKSKYILRPLEQIKVQRKGSIEITELKVELEKDREFKPGFYGQTLAFLKNPSHPDLLTIEEHKQRVEKIYLPILNGTS